jgi:predicted nucleotidyltransferase
MEDIERCGHKNNNLTLYYSHMDLSKFPWGEHHVKFAILFGSRITGKMIKGDWDFAVYFSDFKLEYVADLIYGLSKYLKVREELIDIVPLNLFDTLPCVLILEIYNKGDIIFYDDREFFAKQWLRMRNICLDFMIDYEKLKLHETQLRAVNRSLGL